MVVDLAEALTAISYRRILDQNGMEVNEQLLGDRSPSQLANSLIFLVSHVGLGLKRVLQFYDSQV